MVRGAAGVGVWAEKLLHLWGKNIWEWQKTEVWKIAEGDIKWKRSGMLSLRLRGQVWTTIKTEFHWQPSGNNPHISRKGRDICKHPHPCAHMRPHTHMHVVTHTHTYTNTRQHLHDAEVKQTNKLCSDSAVQLKARGMLEINYEYNIISLHFRSPCSSHQPQT